MELLWAEETFARTGYMESAKLQRHGLIPNFHNPFNHTDTNNWGAGHQSFQDFAALNEVVRNKVVLAVGDCHRSTGIHDCCGRFVIGKEANRAKGGTEETFMDK
jgi:hypothetical protein